MITLDLYPFALRLVEPGLVLVTVHRTGAQFYLRVVPEQ